MVWHFFLKPIDWFRALNPNSMTQIKDISRPVEETGIGEVSNQESRFKQLTEELRFKKEELWEEKMRNDQLEKKLEKLDAERHEVVRQARSLERAYHGETVLHQKTFEEGQEQIKAILKEHEEMSKLLRARSSELKAAQAFLSKADSMSEVDALQVVNDLNMQILQVAASLAEVVEGAEPCQGSVDINVFDNVKSIYGPLLIQEVQRKDPEILQVALQACIIRSVDRITKVWGWYANPSFLNNIYAAIYASEEQSVAGRWRALTRTHIQRGRRDPTDDIIQHLTHELTLVLLCVGLGASYQELSNYVEKGEKKRITAVATLAVQLNKIFGNEITSSDLYLFHGSTGMNFDRNTMEDYYCQNNQTICEPGRVLGGTEFGVIKVVNKSGAGKPDSIQSVLLKAKVVLESILAPVKEG